MAEVLPMNVINRRAFVFEFFFPVGVFSYFDPVFRFSWFDVDVRFVPCPAGSTTTKKPVVDAFGEGVSVIRVVLNLRSKKLQFGG